MTKKKNSNCTGSFYCSNNIIKTPEQYKFKYQPHIFPNLPERLCTIAGILESCRLEKKSISNFFFSFWGKKTSIRLNARLAFRADARNAFPSRVAEYFWTLYRMRKCDSERHLLSLLKKYVAAIQRGFMTNLSSCPSRLVINEHDKWMS